MFLSVMFSFVTLQKRKLHRKEWWTYFLSFIEEFIYFLKHSKPFPTGQLTFYKYMSDPDEHRGIILIRLLGNLNRPHSESVIFIFNNFWTFLTGFSNKKNNVENKLCLGPFNKFTQIFTESFVFQPWQYYHHDSRRLWDKTGWMQPGSC